MTRGIILSFLTWMARTLMILAVDDIIAQWFQSDPYNPELMTMIILLASIFQIWNARGVQQTSPWSRKEVLESQVEGGLLTGTGSASVSPNLEDIVIAWLWKD